MALSVLYILAALYVGAAALWVSVFPGEPTALWIRLLASMFGIGLLSWSAYELRRLFFRSPQLLTITREGFELRDGRGRLYPVRWFEISALEYPGEDHQFLSVHAENGGELAAVSWNFRELYAVIYLIEHMRAKEVRDDTVPW